MVVLLASGCGESVAPKVDPAIGGYALTSVNLKPLPASVAATGGISSSTALNGAIFLEKNGTYTGTVQFQIVRGTVTTVEPYGVPDGIWLRVNDNTLELRPNTGSETSVRGITTATTLNVYAQGLNYGYTRQ